MPSEENYVSRADYDKLRQDYETTLQALTDTLGEADALKERVAALEPLEKQTADLQSKARSLESARAYDRIAEEIGIDPKFKDAVFKLAGYEPKGDEVDEKDIKEHFSKFLEKESAFKKGDGKEPKTLPKGEGSARGAQDPGFGQGDAKPQVTRAQLMDPNFTTKHAATLADPTSYELVDA